jgi:tRNA(fMet)-specific endonuclease VapC
LILDTNGLSAWADGHPGCREHFASASRIVLPSIVLGEFLFGIRQSRYRNRYEAWLQHSLAHTELALVSATTASTYADLRIRLKAQGTPIPSNDLWIAAITLELGLPLLSNDCHFDRVPGVLRLDFDPA